MPVIRIKLSTPEELAKKLTRLQKNRKLPLFTLIAIKEFLKTDAGESFFSALADYGSAEKEHQTCGVTTAKPKIDQTDRPVNGNIQTNTSAGMHGSVDISRFFRARQQ